jgi:diguanylate cyclase (GGDEF)-like protein
MARPCVLIIDDSKFVRTTFRRILQSDFEVREEPDGEAGWNAVSTDPSVALVFCDISMPRLDGFGVLGRIRGAKDERVRHLPVIIISGDEDEATRKRVRDSGANDFISKTADATEVLSRIESQLRLMRAKADASESREAVAQSATHDPLTGAFTLHYLLTEGRKHFSHARRHGTPLTVICFRIDNQAHIVAEAGREFADLLLARIAKAIRGALRVEDTLGRAGESAFAVVLAGTSAVEAAAFARRLREQLAAAQFSVGGRTLKLQASMGQAALDADAAGSIEDLMRLASNRMAQRAGAPAAPAVAPPAPTPAALAPDLERALQLLERFPHERLGDAAPEVLRRLRPFLQALQKRMK